MKENPLSFDQIDDDNEEADKQKQKELESAKANHHHQIQIQDLGNYDEYQNDYPEEEKSTSLESSSESSSSVFKIKNIETGEFEEIDYLEKLNQEFTQVGSIKREGDRATTIHWKEYKRKVKQNNNRLLDLVEDGKLKEIQALVENQKDSPVDLNTRGLGGNTVLHTAVNEGYFEVCKYLLEKGAEPDSINKIEQAPLHFAAKRGETRIIELLLKYSKNINIQDHDKNTPLHLASQMGHGEAVKCLLESKAQVSLLNEFGQTAFDMASSANTKKVFELKGVTSSHELYLKSMVGQTVLGSSRSDHVTRLLYQSRKNME